MATFIVHRHPVPILVRAYISTAAVVKLAALILPISVYLKMFLCRPCSSFTSSQFLLFLQIQIARNKGKIGFKNLDSLKLQLVPQ